MHCAVDGTRLVEVRGADPLIHKAVDRFRIEEHLGTGSTGRVYRATHRTSNQSFAVKIIWGDLGADQHLVRRFQRAAVATRKIRHSSVVRVLEFGTTSAGLSFLVMELIRGWSLRRILDERGPLTPLQTAMVGIQVADGLEAAHAAGFIHRDIKPANLMVDVRSTPPRTKILDFGLVGLAAPDADVRITASGTYIGTPLYMAPEQALNASDLSPAADVYSLGVVLHELLTGKPPFIGGSALEVMIAHSTQAPPCPPPSGGLEKIIIWALEKRPEHRPASAVALATALRGTLASIRSASEAASPLAETLELEPVPRSGRGS